MSATPHANGGVLTRDLDLPDFRDYARGGAAAGVERAESTRQLGELMRDIYAANPDRFRLFCPDETNSNRLGAVFEVSDRAWAERVTGDDVTLSPRRSGDGGAVRAQLPRLARGLHADRPARHVRDVRGVRDGQRLADDPARQVAGGGGACVARQGAEPEHPADVDRLAQ